jgi:hypothetical protein
LRAGVKPPRPPAINSPFGQKLPTEGLAVGTDVGLVGNAVGEKVFPLHAGFLKRRYPGEFYEKEV